MTDQAAGVKNWPRPVDVTWDQDCVSRFGGREARSKVSAVISGAEMLL